MFVSPPNSHVEVLTLHVAVFGNEGSLRKLLKLNEVIRMEPRCDRINVLTRRDNIVLTFSLLLCAHMMNDPVRTYIAIYSYFVAIYKPGREPSPEIEFWHLDHVLLTSRNVRK